MDERLVTTMDTIEMIWQRIIENVGSEFRQVRGKTFTYKLSGNKVLVPSTTNYLISKTQIEKAWNRMPVSGPGALQDLIGPSICMQSYSILASVLIGSLFRRATNRTYIDVLRRR